MNILTRYLIRSFLVTFLGAVAVLTFVLCIGTLFKVTDLLARGVPWRPIGEIFVWSLPDAMSYAVPMGALVASLLLFSRLSADSEITAMRACGLRLGRALWPPVGVAIVLSAVCLVLNGYVAPRGHLARRVAMARLGMQSPLELMEEGRWIDDFPGLMIWVGRRSKDRLTDVRIVDRRTPELTREICAGSGTVRMVGGRDLVLLLENVRVDPADAQRRVPGTFEAMELRVENALRLREYKPREVDLTFSEIRERLRTLRQPTASANLPDLDVARVRLLVEFHKRVVMASSAAVFVFLGAGLGIRSHRRESSVGIAISLLVMFFFYLFVIVAQTLVQKPAWKPHAIVWIPVVGAILLGAWTVRRRI